MENFQTVTPREKTERSGDGRARTEDPRAVGQYQPV